MNLEPAVTFSRAFVTALLDSERTDQLLVAEELSSIRRIERLLPLMRSTAEGKAILAERPRITTATVDFDALRALPLGTLGRTYADHLDRCGLDPDALTVPVSRSSNPAANYLLERIRQTHDIWHAVLGLGAAPHEEVLVHSFQWPQLRMPYSAMIMLFGGAKHLVGELRVSLLRTGVREAVLAGRAAKPLVTVYWERHWERTLESIREELRLRPAHTWRGVRLAA